MTKEKQLLTDILNNKYDLFTPKSTGYAEMMLEISKLLFPRKASKWILIDMDSCQYGRQISDTLFEFKEKRKWGKYQTSIDLSKYSETAIESCINGYGYTLFEGGAGLINIDKLYDKSANWIKAECLFEQS